MEYAKKELVCVSANGNRLFIEPGPRSFLSHAILTLRSADGYESTRKINQGGLKALAVKMNNVLLDGTERHFRSLSKDLESSVDLITISRHEVDSGHQRVMIDFTHRAGGCTISMTSYQVQGVSKMFQRINDLMQGGRYVAAPEDGEEDTDESAAPVKSTGPRLYTDPEDLLYSNTTDKVHLYTHQTIDAHYVALVLVAEDRSKTRVLGCMELLSLSKKLTDAVYKGTGSHLSAPLTLNPSGRVININVSGDLKRTVTMVFGGGDDFSSVKLSKGAALFLARKLSDLADRVNVGLSVAQPQEEEPSQASEAPQVAEVWDGFSEAARGMTASMREVTREMSLMLKRMRQDADTIVSAQVKTKELPEYEPSLLSTPYEDLARQFTLLGMPVMSAERYAKKFLDRARERWAREVIDTQITSSDVHRLDSAAFKDGALWAVQRLRNLDETSG